MSMSMMVKADFSLKRGTVSSKEMQQEGPYHGMMVGGPACRSKLEKVHQACLSQRKEFFINLSGEGLKYGLSLDWVL